MKETQKHTKIIIDIMISKTQGTLSCFVWQLYDKFFIGKTLYNQLPITVSLSEICNVYCLFLFIWLNLTQVDILFQLLRVQEAKYAII